MDYLETLYWKVGLWLLKRGYGYCEERDGGMFMAQGRCVGCNASDVQDWIEHHIQLLDSDYRTAKERDVDNYFGRGVV